MNNFLYDPIILSILLPLFKIYDDGNTYKFFDLFFFGILKKNKFNFSFVSRKRIREIREDYYIFRRIFFGPCKVIYNEEKAEKLSLKIPYVFFIYNDDFDGYYNNEDFVYHLIPSKYDHCIIPIQEMLRYED